MKNSIKIENVVMAVAVLVEAVILVDLIFLIFQDIGILKKLIVILILGFIFGLNAFIIMKNIYPRFCEKNRNTWFCNDNLTNEEKIIINDAKQLLKQAYNEGELVNVKVYSIRMAVHSWMRYDEQNDEISIYVPFKKFMKYGIGFCFYSTLFQIVLAQHFSKSKKTFSSPEFVYELNTLLTVWLIRKYSKKYSEPNQICIAEIHVGDYNVKYNLKYEPIDYQETAITELCMKHNKKLEEVFRNYVDFNPEYFYNFVPEKYI